jgi:uracil-DNA glycosylase family 4
MFTGDESGNWLYAALHRTGFANQAEAVACGDGLHLRDIYVSAVARCAPPANKPTTTEIAACRPYLVRELELFTALRVVVVLGRIAHQGFLATLRARGDVLATPQPRFGHGAIHELPGGPYLICSYHPSQQNTFTKRLTRPMLEQVFRDARRLAGLPAAPRAPKR